MSIKNILYNDKKLEKISKIVFSSIDKDGSGLLDQKELFIVIQSIYEDLRLKLPSKKELKDIFKLLDRNKSGTINVIEFKTLIKCFLIYLLSN